MKLRIMIYHVPTNEIFLSKGVLSPCNLRQGASSLDPCEHLAHRLIVLPTIQNWMTPMHKRYAKGKGVTVGAAPLLQFFDDSRGKWATRGNLQLVMVEAWNPGMESLVEMVQTWEFITKLCGFYSRRKQVFLDF